MFNEGTSSWKLKLDQKELKDGWKCQIYQKKDPKGGKQDLIRVDAVLTNIDIKKVVEFTLYPPPDDMMKEFTIVERTDDGNGGGDYLIYFRFKMPMMSDRDNIMKLSVKFFDNGNMWFATSSVTRDDYPPKPKVVLTTTLIKSLKA